MTIPERRWLATRLMTRAIILFVVLPGVVASAAWARKAPAQSKSSDKPYALIYGTVYGPDDRAVYGVKVHIKRADQKKPKWELYSDHAGEFAQRVPAGRASYVIWADLKGFKPLNGKKLQTGTPVTVEIQNDERADISLHLK